MSCYICSSDEHVDNHHLDCEEGQLSPETVPLCRRCHRTYHDLGVEWFDDEYLDRAIEIENRRREIQYCGGMPLQLMTREDVRRSAYWNKTHSSSINKKADPAQELRRVIPSRDKSKCPGCRASGHRVLPWQPPEYYDPLMIKVRCVTCGGDSYIAPVPWDRRRKSGKTEVMS